MAMTKPDEMAEVTGRSELSPLRGTEKQVAYAEKIRDGKLAQISNAMSNKLWNVRDNNNILALLPEKEQAILSERCKDLEPKERDELLLSTRDSILASERMQKAVEALKSNDDPKFWIDNKDARVSEMLANQYRAVAPEVAAGKEKDSAPKVDGVKADVNVDAGSRKLLGGPVVWPEPRYIKTETVAEIVINKSSNEIRVYSPEKSNHFREVARDGLRCVWDKDNMCWSKRLDRYADDAADRAAEVGRKLLLHGYPVRIDDPNIRAKAIYGNYAPAYDKWVSATPHGEFVVKWDKVGECYHLAAKAREALPGAKYNEQQRSLTMVVPGAAAKAVAAFAEENRFKFTRSAKALLAKSRDNAVSSQLER